MKTPTKKKASPSEMSAADLIKYLNGRRGWHGNQYRSVCGEWIRKADIKRQALRELAADSLQNSQDQAREQRDNPWPGEDSVHRLLVILSLWGELAHDKTKGFCQRFCQKAWILTQVSWDSENMRFVYILHCGQHVADSVKITEWLDFLSANDQVEARRE